MRRVAAVENHATRVGRELPPRMRGQHLMSGCCLTSRIRRDINGIQRLITELLRKPCGIIYRVHRCSLRRNVASRNGVATDAHRWLTCTRFLLPLRPCITLKYRCARRIRRTNALNQYLFNAAKNVSTILWHNFVSILFLLLIFISRFIRLLHLTGRETTTSIYFTYLFYLFIYLFFVIFF